MINGWRLFSSGPMVARANSIVPGIQIAMFIIFYRLAKCRVGPIKLMVLTIGEIHNGPHYNY